MNTKFRPALIIALAISITASMTSCEDILSDMKQQSVTLHSDYYTFSMDVEPSAAGEKVKNKDVSPMNMDKVVKASGELLSSLNTVTVSEAYIEIGTNSLVENFDAVESLVAVAVTPDMVDTLAWAYNIAEGETRIDFEVSDKTISSYLSDEISLEVRAVLDEDLLETLTLDATLKYQLTVSANSFDL